MNNDSRCGEKKSGRNRPEEGGGKRASINGKKRKKMGAGSDTVSRKSHLALGEERKDEGRKVGVEFSFLFDKKKRRENKVPPEGKNQKNGVRDACFR